MEKGSKNNKRNRKKRNEEIIVTEESPKEIINDESSDKYILKKYMDTDIDTLNPTELKKMKPFIEDIKEAIVIFQANKVDNIEVIGKYVQFKVKKI